MFYKNNKMFYKNNKIIAITLTLNPISDIPHTTNSVTDDIPI